MQAWPSPYQGTIQAPTTQNPEPRLALNEQLLQLNHLLRWLPASSYVEMDVSVCVSAVLCLPGMCRAELGV